MISWSKQLFDNIVINLNTDGTGEEIVPSSLEFSFQAPNEYIMNCESNLITDVLTWSRDGDILTVQNSVLGFKANISGNSFSVTRNADQLVQILFGPTNKDNETMLYTKD